MPVGRENVGMPQQTFFQPLLRTDYRFKLFHSNEHHIGSGLIPSSREKVQKKEKIMLTCRNEMFSYFPGCYAATFGMFLMIHFELFGKATRSQNS